MNPIQISELKAFIFSLSQLDEPLPSNIQTKINQVNIPLDIDNFYDIAVSYPPLSTIYKQVLDLLDKRAEYRSKGLSDIPQYQPEKRNTDIDNDLVEIDKKLIEFEEVVDDNNKLTKLAVKMTMALNSVEVVKSVILNPPF
jgi:hypothetical protein